jgi:hypothetical protein
VKKQLLTLALLASAATAAQAQTQRVHFGLKAGGCFAKFGGGGVLDASRLRAGLSGGALAEVTLTEHWAVQPELLYTAKGSKILYGGNVDSYQRLGYLEVPVMVKYKIPHFFVEAGPQLGVLLHANYELNDVGGTTETQNKDLFRGTDLGYALGLGVQDTNGLLLGVRYNGGLTRLAADNAAATGGGHNSAFYLYVGYIFGSAK